jgi:hypothetical protein
VPVNWWYIDIYSRQSYISSATLLRNKDLSMHKPYITVRSIREWISSSLKRSWRQFPGWKTGVIGCSATAVVVCLLNISLTVWAVTNHQLVGGISYLYTGSCSKVEKMSLWIHLGINVMSTVLLSASNCKLSHPIIHRTGESVNSLQTRCKS